MSHVVHLSFHTCAKGGATCSGCDAPAARRTTDPAAVTCHWCRRKLRATPDGERDRQQLLPAGAGVWSRWVRGEGRVLVTTEQLVAEAWEGCCGKEGAPDPLPPALRAEHRAAAAQQRRLHNLESLALFVDARMGLMAASEELETLDRISAELPVEDLAELGDVIAEARAYLQAQAVAERRGDQRRRRVEHYAAALERLVTPEAAGAAAVVH